MWKFSSVALLVGLSILISLGFANPVQAQAGWCYIFDFENEDDGGWVRRTSNGENNGDYTEGVGWTHTDHVNTNPSPDISLRGVVIMRSFEARTLTHVTLVYDYLKGNNDGVPPNSLVTTVIQINETGGFLTSRNYGNEADANDKLLQWDGEQAGVSNLVLYSRSSRDITSPYAYGGLVTFTLARLEGLGTNPFGEDNCGEPPTGTLTRPLATQDEHEQWGMYDAEYVQTIDPEFEITTSYPYSVYAWANQAHVDVSAVAAGTVVEVRPFNRSLDCPLRVGSLVACYIVIPQPITQEEIAFVYNLEAINISQIVIRDEVDPNITYTYYVTNATVQEGDSVVAGCILGKTMQVKNLSSFELSSIGGSAGASAGEGGPGGGFSIGGDFTFRSLLVDAGYTVVIMKDEGEPVSLFPELVLPPNQTNCKDETLSGCMNDNPDLRSLDGNSIDDYLYDPGVLPLSGGGVSIPNDQRIYQGSIITSPETTYTLSVQARDARVGDDEAGTIRLSVSDGLNQDFEDYPLNLDGQWENYTFTPTGLEPGPITISVSNGDSSPIEVRYICFAPSTISTAPGSCYFANPEFDADASNWTFTGVTFASGQAYMPDESTLQQSVVLNPTSESESHTYTLSAQVRLIATTAYTAQVGKSVTLDYRYDSEEYTELGTIDSSLVTTLGLSVVTGAVNVDYPYEFEDSVEVSEATTAPFTFRVSVTDDDNYIIGLRIDWVCLTPSTDDGSFPGQPGDGGFIPPLIVGCSVVPLPLDGSVAAWTFYHWSNLKRFFNCDLMKLLNKWFQLFDQFRRVLLNVARYWIALVHHLSDWATTVFWWFNGQFRNVAEGQIIVISGGDSGCHDLFCAITNVVGTLANLLNPIVEALNNVVNTLLGVLIGAVNLFFTLVEGLIGFVVALVIRLFTFLQTGLGLLTGLVTAYNTATPTAIPGLPTCASDPDSSLICRGVWVLDNTILAGRWGVLFTIILSVLAIHLILWAIREFREVLLKTWSSS